MNKLPNLNDHELHGVLLNALRTAAEAYRNDALNARIDGKQFPAFRVTHDGLAERFERQAAEATALADRLENESADA
jgi:hypothetical protein